MASVRLLLLALVVTACGDMLPNPESAPCRRVDVDGIPCVYCVDPVGFSHSVALSCDWTPRHP